MRSMTERRRARIEKVLGQRQKDLTLVLDNIHDPHNVSAIYRSCDAFGVAGVHLYYTHAPFPSLSRKTSASARKWVETLRHDSREELMKALRAGGFQVLATSCTPEAKPVAEYDFTRPTAIIMGNEHAGSIYSHVRHDPELQCLGRRRAHAGGSLAPAQAGRHVRAHDLDAGRI